MSCVLRDICQVERNLPASIMKIAKVAGVIRYHLASL